MAGEFVRLTVKPLGADLAVVLLRDGSTLVEAAGPETAVRAVSFVAEGPSVHHFEVRAAGAAARRGRYRLAVGAWRPARDDDGARVATDRLMAEGQRLRREGSGDALREAAERFRRAAERWRALGERDAEADALGALGEATFALRDTDGARAIFLRELPLRREVGDRAGEAEALNNLGVMHGVLGERRQALEFYERALPIHRALGDTQSEAQTLRNMGVSWLALDEHQKAADAFAASLPLRRQAGDRRGEGFTLHSLGGLYYRLGQLDAALEHAEQALVIRRELGDRGAEGQTLQSIGLVHAARGDHARARGFYLQALPLVRETGDRLAESTVLQGLAETYRDEDPARALAEHERALAIHRALKNRPFESLSMHLIGTLLAARGEVAAARQHLEEALAIRRDIGDRSGEAQTLHALARLDRDQGELDRARARMEQALAIVDALRVKVTRHDLRQSFVAARQELYEDHVELLMERHRRRPGPHTAGAAFAASDHARARTLRDLLLEAGAELRRGLDPALADRLRLAQETLNDRERERLSVVGGTAGEDERAKARQAVEDALFAYQGVEAGLRASNPRLAGLRHPAARPAVELQSLLDPDTLVLEYALGARRSYVFAATREAVVPFELPPRARIEAVVRRFRERLLGSRHRAGVAAARAAASDLAELLLGPVAASLSGRRLVVVPDGALHLVPFGVLPGPSTGRPLIVDHEVVHLPALSVLAQLRDDAAARHGGAGARVDFGAGSVAVIADPVLDPADARVRGAAGGRPAAALPSALTRSLQVAGETTFARLPFTRREAEAIRRLAGADATFLALDFAASRETVMSGALSDARVVHFATHGLMNGEHPELSGIVLSLVDEAGRPRDGFLRLHEIYDLDLSAELVVLSACRTAVGREVRGEGVVGLARGFMYAGAPRVIASLWDVRDEASAELMRRFYRGLLREGLRPAAALRAAQVSLAREPRWRAPFYWAGFVLQGEWR